MKQHSLSVIILTHNSEKTLYDCLSSIHWANEIIILDHNSTDKTQNIAKKFKTKIFNTKKWLGFGKQRQIAQTYANGDYILMLDADEYVSHKLYKEIITILKSQKKINTVYSCIRYNLFINKFIHHSGWYPDRKIRIYPKEYCYNSMKIHEKLDIQNAKIKKLKGKLIHLACLDFYKFQKKQIKYAKIWANEQFKKKKYCNILTIIIHKYSAFLKTWILQKGFLDGKYGWLIATINSQYTFNKYSILWFLINKKNKTTKQQINKF